SAPERAAAAAAVAQPSPVPDARAAEAAVAPPAPRPVELRPSTERRASSVSTSAPADPNRASPAGLAQGFDPVSLVSGADRPAAPQRTDTAESLPLPATPGAASAGSSGVQPLTPPHTPGVSLPHAAAGLDGSSQTAMPPSAQQGGSVDTTAARWHDALASRLQWLVDHDVGEARIKLNPPELGALDVKISLHDDKTFVQVTAHNAAARDELSQSLPRLRELLSANGLELGGATVSGGRDDGAGRYSGAEPAARSLDFAAADPEPAVRALARPSASSRIDVFA
ncbi:MAG TPA: flagellar hook-length control protein FliK, partial [Gammaproteobacteria bacterium]|nr:flagellar hook-length control protein FliK [Gammaproteobacteria bacterium]